MKEYKWGRIMTANAIGLMIGWGTSIIPNRRYMSLEIPFLIIQIYTSKQKQNKHENRSVNKNIAIL